MAELTTGCISWLNTPVPEVYSPLIPLLHKQGAAFCVQCVNQSLKLGVLTTDMHLFSRSSPQNFQGADRHERKGCCGSGLLSVGSYDTDNGGT